MNIYFAASIRGGREDAGLYAGIIQFLKESGTVFTEHIGDPSLTEQGDEGLSDTHIHERDMKWLMAADVMVAEVTTLSLGVGYEIGRAVAAGKRVICLYRPRPGKKLSAMIAGNRFLTILTYDDLDELRTRLSIELDIN